VCNYAFELVDRELRSIKVTVMAHGSVVGDLVDVAIPSLNCHFQVQLAENGVGSTVFHAPIALWSPQSPTLYDITLSYHQTTITDWVGFRTIETKGGEILLNGAPVFLKGISMHEESIARQGRSFGADDARTSLELVKKLGANFVRLSHYPHDEATTRMADELGLLVWSEIPVYWSIDWVSPAALETATAQLHNNIVRDTNRACIIIWSVGNETPMSAPRLEFMKSLVATARNLDSSRLVSAALFGDPMGFLRTYSAKIMAHVALDPQTTLEARNQIDTWFREKANLEPSLAQLTQLIAPTTHLIDDPLGDDLDVVAYNQYFGWYPAGFLSRLLPLDEATIRLTEFKIMKTLTLEPRQNKPLIASEFGADAKKGFIGDQDTVFSELFQVRYYQTQLAMLSLSTKLRGMSPWVLKDFRTFLRTHPDYQEFWNRKGLVDENGQPKAVFELLQNYYTSLGSDVLAYRHKSREQIS
jgi:beta-glucuronidase